MQLKKTLSILSTVGALLGATAASAQTARVQIIHNCADAAAAEVDIYLNGSALPAIEDVAFRTATPFIDLPAGSEIVVGIAPGTSTGPADIIASFPFTLADGGSYIVVANGIVSPTGYIPVQPFTLNVFDGARETGSDPAKTDVLVLHGSTDAQTVDVFESAVINGIAVDNISYPEFQGYLTLPTEDYVLEVQREDGSATIAAYSAPLAALGLENKAITVIASGFLNPSDNSNGPAFGLWVALSQGGDLVELPLALGDPTARVQIIHNCADAAAAVVDIYLNGGATPALENVAFRTATAFLDLPAESEIVVGIAPGTSTGPADIIASFPFTLDNGGSYIIVANGIVSATGYSPAPAFTLNVFATAREVGINPANTDVLVLHGSTDAPTVDVFESAVINGVAVDNISYPEFAGYLSLPTDNYVLNVQTADGVTTVASYSAPLATLGLEGAAITVLASGFLNPANNSDGAAFGLWVALAAGGPLVELPNPTARVQIIHNSADAAAAVVDIYLNGGATPALDNVAFRTATAFLDLPAESGIVVGIAPGTSTGPADIIASFPFTLDNGGSYIIVANGIVSATGYNPAPAFSLDVFAGAREEATVPTQVNILVQHGCTDAPEVQVAELAVLGGAVIVAPFSYGDFDGYLEVPTADYALQVQLPNGTPVAAYSAPLATLSLDGAAFTVLASGFLSPANNSNGPNFGLWAALATGGALVELPLITNISVNENQDNALALNAWPNPANDVLNLSIDAKESRRVAATMTDMTGRVVLEVPNTIINTGENRLEIDLSQLAQGIYSLAVVGENGIRTIAVQVAR